jgi:hypothetical protein
VITKSIIHATRLSLVTCMLLAGLGCTKNPPVQSEESLQAMRLLYSACNAKDPARLKKVEIMVNAGRETKTWPEEELATFDKILSLAKAGEWKKAEDAAYKFAEDQVGQGKK